MDPAVLRQRLTELIRPAPMTAPAAEAVESQLAETRRRIGRLVEALAGGPEDLPSVRTALASLETERSRLEGELTRARATAPAGSGDRLEEIVDRLLESLHQFRDVLAVGTLEQRKAVVRSFLAGILVEKATRQAILRWYRLPRDLSAKLVELRGSKAWGVSVKTIQNWVWHDRRGGLTIPFVVGARGAVRFRLTDALALFDRHLRFETSPRRGRPRRPPPTGV